jgi:2-dehydropantoate 2-reductase
MPTILGEGRMRIERVVVLGAGAMGSFFAARLAETGSDVTLIDVDDVRLERIAADGITIDDDRGPRVVPVAAGRADAVTGPADLIILFTKGVHTAAGIRSVAHLVGPVTRALTLQTVSATPRRSPRWCRRTAS